MNAMRLALIAGLAGLAVSAGTASAGVITSGTVYNNTGGEFSSAFASNRMTNQSGLSSGYVDGVTNFQTYTTSGVTHDTHETFVSWLSNGVPSFPFVIDFDFGSSKSIQSLAIWNGTSGDNAAIQGFAVFTSSAANFSVSTLMGTFTNPMGTSAPEPVTVFDAVDSVAQYARIQVLSYYGSFCCTGIGEVAWDVGGAAAAVPEPGTLALLGLGVGGLAALGRRKR